MRIAPESELLQDGDGVDIEGDTRESDADDALESGTGDTNDASAPRSREPVSTLRRAMLFGLVVVVALAAVVGWYGFRIYQSHRAQTQRSEYLQAARQGALNLTSIDWQHADTDVKRILDGATGEFYDDFAKRSQPFVDAVRQVKATTVGTVTAAGLESEVPGRAQALVAVAVKTSNAGAPEQAPRAWRMRIFVQKVDGQVKVSNVEFVP